MAQGTVNCYRLIQLVSRAGDNRPVSYPDLGDCPAFNAAVVVGCLGVTLFCVALVWWLFRERE